MPYIEWGVVSKIRVPRGWEKASKDPAATGPPPHEHLPLSGVSCGWWDTLFLEQLSLPFSASSPLPTQPHQFLS